MMTYFEVRGESPSASDEEQEGKADESGAVDSDINASKLKIALDDSTELLKLIQADDQNHCFLTFRKEEGGMASALLLHHMTQYPSRLGDDSPFAGQWFVTGGQPVGGVHITYDVPPDMFEISSPMQTYSTDRIQRELGNDISAKTLVPVASTENLADLDLVTTRRSMWIPHQYAALCVDEELSPAEVFTRVYGAILSDGVVDECQPLVDFMRAQIVGSHHSNSCIFLDSELTQHE
jgi:hypothetical protein